MNQGWSRRKNPIRYYGKSFMEILAKIIDQELKSVWAWVRHLNLRSGLSEPRVVGWARDQYPGTRGHLEKKEWIAKFEISTLEGIGHIKMAGTLSHVLVSITRNILAQSQPTIPVTHLQQYYNDSKYNLFYDTSIRTEKKLIFCSWRSHSLILCLKVNLS